MLNYIHWNIEPEIFKIGSIAIRYYSLLFVGGLIVSYYILKKVFIKENMPLEWLDKLFIYVGVGTVLGARLGHVFFYEWYYYKNHMLEILLPIHQTTSGYEFSGFQGLASHGAAIGIVLSVILFALVQKKNALVFFDKIALVIPLAGAMVRFGNLMNSEIIGKATNLSFGFIFERVDEIPRHPSQLYEALGYVFTFVIVMLAYRRLKDKVKPGFFLGLMMIGIFTARFFIEFVKENQESFENDMAFNMGQWLSIPFVLAGIALVVIMRKKS
ncbi:MAG: prolipoprotein diacylglyceryl transferase [Bacteroidales bacterium]|nr:prolipoprotein diacylglyceryl transferase [Bacteroidales bacterium]